MKLDGNKTLNKNARVVMGTMMILLYSPKGDVVRTCTSELPTMIMNVLWKWHDLYVREFLLKALRASA
jgi:hypothetical protein